MSATSPWSAAHPKKAGHHCLLLLLLAATWGGLVPAVTAGAEADHPGSLPAAADDKARAAQLLQNIQ